MPKRMLPWAIIPKAKVLYSDHGKRYVHCSGGRAGGKTIAVAQRLIVHALEEPGVRILCVRHQKETTKASIKVELETLIDDNGLRSKTKGKRRDDILWRNGSEMQFLGLQNDPRAIKGFAQTKYVMVEEGEEITPAEWQFLWPTIRRDAIIYICMNPSRADDILWREFYPTDDFEPSKAPSSLLLDFNWADLKHLKLADGSPMLPPNYVADIEHMIEKDPITADWMWGGALQMRPDALIFHKGKHWDIGQPKVPAHAETHYGLDFAGIHTPAVGIRCRSWDDNVHVEAESFRHRADDALCRAIIAEIVNSQGAVIVTDQNMRLTAGRTRKGGGYDVKFALKGPDSIMNGVHYLRTRNITVDPSCKMLIRQMSRWSMRIDARTDEVALPEKPTETGKDAIDALRYAMEDSMLGFAKKRESGVLPFSLSRHSNAVRRTRRF